MSRPSTLAVPFAVLIAGLTLAAAPVEAAPEDATAPTDSTAATDPTAAPSVTSSTGVTSSEIAEPQADAASGPAKLGDWRDPTEAPGARQLYIGVRYRGTVVPQFLINLFVDEGRTVGSSSVSLDFDIRRDNLSVIPNLTFAEYGLEDTLFREKGKDPAQAGNYSMVNSSLKTLFLGVDVLWSARLHRMLDFEYGLGVGVGYVFGDLVVNWVYQSDKGSLTGQNGLRYAPCEMATTDGTPCNPKTHIPSDKPKVGRYVEPNWLAGGPVPAFYARLALPTLGLRFKPIRDVEARLQFGFSLTEGFFFGVGAAYRIPTGK